MPAHCVPSPHPAAPVCLVTGGSGLVGRAIVHRLVQQQCPVRMAVRALPPGGTLPQVQVVTGQTLGADADWSPALSGVATVLHLAARVHMLRDAATDPLVAYRAVNTEGTLRLARQAADAGVRRFVFVSTVKVHGESTPPGQALTEAVPAAPTDAYALSKHEAEQGLADIADRTGMQVVVIRPPLVYGPGVKANFAALVRAVARGLPLPFGAIDNRRSLVGVDNLVDVLLLCLTHPAAAGQAFFVSDGEDLSTPTLVRRIAAAMDRPARLLSLPLPLLRVVSTCFERRDAMERLCSNLQVDITKARTLLNWSPPFSVDEGLRRAVAGLVP